MPAGGRVALPAGAGAGALATEAGAEVRTSGEGALALSARAPALISAIVLSSSIAAALSSARSSSAERPPAVGWLWQAARARSGARLARARRVFTGCSPWADPSLARSGGKEKGPRA